MPKDTLTITDNRTGKTYEVPIENGCIRTNNLRQIKVSEEDFGLMGYDPAFLNTANCKSAITYIDGDKGILEYRGYPIEQLAEKSSFLEVCYLLLNGELPTAKELEQFCSWSACRMKRMSRARSSVGCTLYVVVPTFFSIARKLPT